MTSDNNSDLLKSTSIEMGLNPDRWSRVMRYAEQMVSTQAIPALAFEFQKEGKTSGVFSFGSRSLQEMIALNDETRFLIASLTKPMVAMATLLLVERGQLALNQRVSEIVPEFRGANKRQISIKNILTHTSGLPDMLPENRELRSSQSTLMDFIKGTSDTEMIFPCGTNSQYQSMGYALLGAVIENVSGTSYQKFIKEELFEPLGMSRTSLGLPEEEELSDPNIAEVEVPDDQVGEKSWNWNSPYWKRFGAPWGGTLASVADVSRFCRCMLTGGLTSNGTRLFSKKLVHLATTNRLHDFPEIPEPVRRTRSWGYGWRMNWLDHRGSFGDLLGPEVYGHWGATGTLFWMDNKSQSALVILSTKPYGRSVSPLVPLSNMISAAID